MKIFIIESPSPNDLLDERNEKSSLENMCKIFGHQSTSFTTYSKEELIKTINYISLVKIEDEEVLCLHFSCHGNNDGLAFGADFLTWLNFTKILAPIFKRNKLSIKTIVVISACGANGQIITDKINQLDIEIRKKLIPPAYFFVYNQDKVLWRDALLCWAILYHQLNSITDFSKTVVQSILNRIKFADFGDIIYFRWDTKKLRYMKFSSNKS